LIIGNIETISLSISIIIINLEAKTPPAYKFIVFQVGGHPAPVASLLSFFFGHHLSAKTAKFCCFLTYNNMG
jgi:hypothetical protein